MSACPPPSPPSSSFRPSSPPRPISTASSRSQWASPDLLCQLLIAVDLAGPHLPALDRSGPRRTSTASSRSQWASPDLNGRKSERCAPPRTSRAGPQPARFGALWASPDPNRTSTARNKAISTAKENAR